MMHGREKSDSAIVAVKPANNDGQPSAESVERRAGAEGNAGQDRMHRAQDRESVSQGLDRVRQVRRQTPKVGAGCGNPARPDLCGGRSVTSVPTAIRLMLLSDAFRIGGLDARCLARNHSGALVDDAASGQASD
jgi:hypothetical protein